MRLNVGLNEIDSQRIFQFPRGPRARAWIVKYKGVEYDYPQRIFE